MIFIFNKIKKKKEKKNLRNQSSSIDNVKSLSFQVFVRDCILTLAGTISDIFKNLIILSRVHFNISTLKSSRSSSKRIKLTIFFLPILFILYLSTFKQDEFSIEFLIHLDTWLKLAYAKQRVMLEHYFEKIIKNKLPTTR